MSEEPTGDEELSEVVNRVIKELQEDNGRTLQDMCKEEPPTTMKLYVFDGVNNTHEGTEFIICARTLQEAVTIFCEDGGTPGGVTVYSLQNPALLHSITYE